MNNLERFLDATDQHSKTASKSIGMVCQGILFWNKDGKKSTQPFQTYDESSMKAVCASIRDYDGVLDVVALTIGYSIYGYQAVEDKKEAE